jgi:C1A family cysteine protease
MLRTRLLPLTLIAIFLLSGSIFAQLSKSDIVDLKERAKVEDWTFTVGENPATEYPLEELCGMVEPPDWRVGANFDPMTSAALAALPSAFDWRDYNGCTPIRNQGGCGSCWAFATVGPLECNIKIREGTDVNLSEQWLLSCNRVGWDCGGGWWAHGYHMNGTDACGGTGAVLESDFPYVGYSAPCNCPYPHHYLIDSWAYIGSEHSVAGVEPIKQAILKYGPVGVSIHVNSPFQAYRGGIFNACDPGEINHAVVIVGWDDSQGENGVWIMRNSWGTWWGENGYMRIPYGCNQIGYSACYVNYRPIDMTANVELAPSPTVVTFGMDVPWTEVTACQWDFGDGAVSSEPVPVHEYSEPGYYDVKLVVTTPEGEFTDISPGMVSIYADTMKAEVVQLDPTGGPFRVDVNVKNFLALKELRVPFKWEGPLNIVYDSFTVAGTRTQNFEMPITINYDPVRYRSTLALMCGSAAPLNPGSGPVVSLWFTAPGGLSGVNPIQFVSYAVYEPRFYAFGGDYQPAVEDGMVYTGVTIGCCEGRVGDANLSGEDEPTIGDVSTLIDHLFIQPRPFGCTEEADINQSGGSFPTFDDVTIGDVSALIDYLFISGNALPDCL